MFGDTYNRVLETLFRKRKICNGEDNDKIWLSFVIWFIVLIIVL